MTEAKHTPGPWSFAHPSQAHWPRERCDVIKHAVAADGGKWPADLPSGVMFYMGERITRAEFEAVVRRDGGNDGSV